MIRYYFLLSDSVGLVHVSLCFLGHLEVSTCLKNKIQPNKFENLIIFIQEFMNQEISHLENRRVIQGMVPEWKVFIGRSLEQGSY